MTAADDRLIVALDVPDAVSGLDLTSRLGARVHVVGGLWAYGDLNTYQRDTNRSSGLDYRDYRGVFSRAGVSLFH